jgi:hypothetical protein
VGATAAVVFKNVRRETVIFVPLELSETLVAAADYLNRLKTAMWFVK